VLFLALAVIGCTADLWTKSLAFSRLGLPGEGDIHWIIKGYFGFETAVNPGALFGMGAGWGWMFAALSLVATVGLLLWLARWKAIGSLWLVVALGLVQGGIVGNLYDRLGLWNPPTHVPAWRSGVRDWIRISYGQYVWPNFNIADSLLVCGACMLAWHSFSKKPEADQPTAS
jgi:signal peptidase II